MDQRPKEFGLTHLRAFRECVRQMSYSGAARTLGVSQPAVWQQIRGLENSLGAALFEKQGRSLALTDAGRVLLEHVTELLGAADSLVENFQAACDGSARSLVIVGTSGVLTEDIAGTVTRFKRGNPELRLRLVSHVGEGTINLLLGGDADFAILPSASELVDHSNRLQSEVIRHRVWVAAFPEEHPLQSRRSLRLRDVLEYPLVIPERGSGWRRFLDDQLRQQAVMDKVQVAIEVSLTVAMRRYVSLGWGVAVLPLSNEFVDWPGIKLVPLEDELPAESILVHYRRSDHQRPVARRFLEFLREERDGVATSGG